MEAFFDTIRVSPFKGRMSKKQVEGCEIIINEFRAAGHDNSRWLAYILATAYHETAHLMQPVKEFGRGRGRKYGKPGPHRGQIAYGRGFVQLTWPENYERADRELGLNGKLIDNYDLALDPIISARILIRGMVEGWFTGKKLDDYFRSDFVNWTAARRIVNGTDRAKLIAGYGRDFYLALQAQEKVEPIPPPPDIPAPQPPEQPAQSGLFFWLKRVFKWFLS